MRRFLLTLGIVVVVAGLAAAQQYDVVLEGGRVMDPETGLDAVRNVGIRDGRIVQISATPLSGRRVIHATGLVESQRGLYRPPPARSGYCQPAGQGLRRRDHRARNGDRRAGCGAVSEVEGRALDHSLRHDGQPCRGAGIDFRRAVAGGNDPAKRWPGHRPACYARTGRAHPTAPARPAGRRGPRRRHGHPVHARRDAA